MDALAANLRLLDEANLAATPCQWCGEFAHDVRTCPHHQRVWMQLVRKRVTESRWDWTLTAFWWTALGFVVGVLVGKGCGV